MKTVIRYLPLRRTRSTAPSAWATARRHAAQAAGFLAAGLAFAALLYAIVCALLGVLDAALSTAIQATAR